MDLSKVFGTKFKSYGADYKTTEMIHDYLTNRRQRVRLGDQLSNWKEIPAGVPQDSALGPFILSIFMNDLVYAVKQSRLSAYAADTHIVFTGRQSSGQNGRLG